MKVKLMFDQQYTGFKLKKDDIVEVTRNDSDYYKYLKSYTGRDSDKTLIPVIKCEVIEDETLEELTEYLSGFMRDVVLASSKTETLLMSTEIHHNELRAFVEYIIVERGTGKRYIAANLKDAMERFIRLDTMVAKESFTSP